MPAGEVDDAGVRAEDVRLKQLHLVDRAFKLKRETAAFKFQDDELPLLMASAAMFGDRQNMKEVSLG